jgi:hypothetical protein
MRFFSRIPFALVVTTLEQEKFTAGRSAKNGRDGDMTRSEQMKGHIKRYLHLAAIGN